MAGRTKAGLLIEQGEAGHSIAIWQRRASRQGKPQSEMARQRNVGRQRIIEVSIWIWWQMDASQKLSQFSHLGPLQACRRRLKIGERTVEGFNAWPVSAPMKRLVPKNFLQGLGYHYPLHGVIGI